MSRTITFGLVAALLIPGAGTVAWSQNASPGGTPSANQSSPGQPPSGPKSTGAPSVGAGGPSTGAAAGAPTTPSDAASGASRPAASDAPAGSGGQASTSPDATKGSTQSKRVCFNLTGRCVEGRKASAHSPAGGAANGSNGSSSSLDLAAPDVRKVVPAEELKEPLPTNEQITEVQESQTVAVKGEGPPPDVPMGFGAIWWALGHPSQAWRIFTPAE